MAFSKDNIVYYRIKFQELLKEAEENGIEVDFHIMEISIKNKKTKEETSVRDNRLEKRMNNNYYR